MPSFTFSDLQNSVADPYMIASVAEKVKIFNVLNRAARLVFLETDLRSSKRRSSITPTLFSSFYDYTAPSDLKDNAVIDIIPQGIRSDDTRIDLVSNEEFDRKKNLTKNLLTMGDNSFTRTLRLSIDPDETSISVSELDTTTDPNGTWTAYSDAANLTADTSNYVSGGGSLKFDLTGSGTTAGIVNSTLTAIDITKYINDGSAVVWVYINSTTNLTNFILQIGTDSSNYYQLTETTQGSGNAFQAGWNQLVFDFLSKTTTGTPTSTSTQFVRLFMTKSSGKSDDGYRFDALTLHTGKYFDVLYYSKFAWQVSGTYQETATATTDTLNADTEEFDLLVLKGRMELSRDLRDYMQYNLDKADYEAAKARYKRTHPSERKLLISNY